MKKRNSSDQLTSGLGDQFKAKILRFELNVSPSA